MRGGRARRHRRLERLREGDLLHIAALERQGPMFQHLLAILAKVRVRMHCYDLQCNLRFERPDARQCIGTLALEGVKVFPLDEVIEAFPPPWR